MKIKLDDAARARYGCAEWLDWDSARLSVREAEEIQERTGLGPNDWRGALKEPSATVLRMVIWLCLNRAGHQIGWSDVDFDVYGLDHQDDEPEPPSPGKDPSTPQPTSEHDATP